MSFQENLSFHQAEEFQKPKNLPQTIGNEENINFKNDLLSESMVSETTTNTSESSRKQKKNHNQKN